MTLVKSAVFKALKKKAERRARRQDNATFIRKISGKLHTHPIQLTHKTAVKQLDAICSLIVRQRDRKVYMGQCLVCIVKRALGVIHRPARVIQVAYHVIPRGNMAVRFDLRNLVAACAPCNFGEKMSRSSSGTEHTRAVYRRIHTALIGEKALLELEELAKQLANFSVADLIEKRDDLKKQLEAGI